MSAAPSLRRRSALLRDKIMPAATAIVNVLAILPSAEDQTSLKEILGMPVRCSTNSLREW